MTRKDEFTIKVDENIGRRVWRLRLEMGQSRQQLASKIGVTHQQLQKYETGANRISVGRIAYIANALKKPVAYFFEGVYEDDYELPTEHQRMTIEMSRSFMRIKNPKHQYLVNELVRGLADANEI